MSEAIGIWEFAEKYGVTQATVSKWCREGKIPNCNQDGNPDLRNQPTEDMWDFKDEEEDQDDSWDEEEDDWDEEDY